MAEPAQIIFDYKEVAEALVKRAGIHEGIWGLFFRFGMQATNFGPNPNELKPTVIVPILQIGIQRFSEESSISVDAAKVNPAPTTKPKTVKK